MEWSDQLKRDVGGLKHGYSSVNGSIGDIAFFIVLVLAGSLFLFCLVADKEVQADGMGQLPEYQSRMLKAQEDQVGEIKRIANELRKIRIEMKRQR